METHKLSRKLVSILFAAFIVINLLFFCFQILAGRRLANARSLELKASLHKFGTLKIQSLKATDLDAGDNNKIILRLLGNACHECLDSIFKNTIRLSNTFGKQSVVVLLNEEYSEDQYFTFKRLYQYNLNIYQQKDTLTSLDAKGNSYYFIFNKNKPGIAQRVFTIFDARDAGHSPIYKTWHTQLQ